MSRIFFGNARLMADISLASFTGNQFNIIGNDTTPFTGTFDGNGYEISNFTYSSAGSNYIGIFGYVYAANAEIKNLRKYPTGDLNHDGRVDFLDFAIVAEHWLEGTE